MMDGVGVYETEAGEEGKVCSPICVNRENTSLTNGLCNRFRGSSVLSCNGTIFVCCQ